MVDSSGMDNMGTQQGLANRVTDENADSAGGTVGVEKNPIAVDNPPEHEHDLRGPKWYSHIMQQETS